MASTFLGGLATLEAAVIVLLIVVLLLARGLTSLKKGSRLPPGPRGWPLVGNVTDMPSKQECLTFTRWAKEYGDLVYITLLGRPMVFVNSAAVAHDLFDARSLIYSDRFEFPMLKLSGADWFFGHLPYGEKWRWHRKAFHRHFSSTAVTAYRDIETKHTRVLLRKLHDSPENFIQHLRYLPGANIMEIIYGINVLPHNDPYIEIAEKSMAAGTEAGTPGAFLVDVFPMLRHVPEWFPGASFRRKARIWRETIIRLPVVPYEAVKAALRTGTATSCVVTSLIEETSDDKNSHSDEYTRNTAASAYLAGVDTTVSALMGFVLAMVVNQDAQMIAQTELDSVVGERLPGFDDREHLPYVNAICKELHRWHTVLPMGLAHVVSRDDVYGDYFIPRRSIVLPNAWAMLRDETAFGADPEEFRPERFLQPGVADPFDFAFGFGRRACPGRYLADDMVFMAVASILKIYRISLAKDPDGVEIPVQATFTRKFLSHPEPFVCSIKPRTPFAESFLFECPNE